MKKYTLLVLLAALIAVPSISYAGNDGQDGRVYTIQDSDDDRDDDGGDDDRGDDDDMDHGSVAAGTCASCHNGSIAEGKDRGHVSTTASCDTCHYTTDWEPTKSSSGGGSSSSNHSNVAPGTCATCHNGTIAEGKDSGHVSTTASCDTCHYTTDWKPTRISSGGGSSSSSHDSVAAGTCATCHNGIIAEGKDRDHISTTASCDSCHMTSDWEPAIGSGAPTGSHSNVAAGTCATCHNGVIAEGKDRGHISTTASCDVCHFTNDWEPTRNSSGGGTGTTMDHSMVAAGTCAACHNGSVATGKSATHISTTASCDTCHQTTGWTTSSGGGTGTTMDHSTVAAGTCASCHNGTFATGKSTTHISTTASCDTCHQTTGWTTSSGGVTMDHSGVAAGTCATCHDGATATGKGSAHISTTASCDACHQTTGWTAGPAAMDHGSVTAGTCAACHNGTFATGKSAGHIGTSASCDTCHQTTGWTAGPAAMDHSSVATGSCATCHNGAFATGKGSSHISTAASCDTCHQTTGWTSGPATMNHSNVTAGTCATCHNGTFATGKSSTHISTAASCATCHQTTGWTGGPAAMDHSSVATGSCATCHNGTFATGKSTGHIATTASCDTCHQTAGWTGGATTMDHSNVAAGTCTTCHDGTSATGKSAGHIATTASCDTCHQTTGWTAGPATMDHSNVVAGTCATCHNGTFASGQNGGHTPTVASCDSCHQTTGWPLGGGTGSGVDHSGVAAGTCANCHNGTAATGKSVNHFATNASCDSCHLTSGWTIGTGSSAPAAVTSTLDFPVDAVFASLASTASTYTASATDTIGNSYELSVTRTPGAGKTEPNIFSGPLSTYKQTNTLTKNGTTVYTENFEVFYSAAPFSLFGNLNDLYGGNNYMKVSTQYSLPTTGRVDDTALLYKGRNYLNNDTVSPDVWFARWSLKADTETTAWLCLNVKITPTSATSSTAAMAASSAETECFQIDATGAITGYKADIVDNGATVGLSNETVTSGSTGTVGEFVVEFYNTTLDHYFMTADPGEMDIVDNGGAGPGWVRTGYSFKTGGSASVCRFYGSQAPGPNSHFYTVAPDECDYLKQLESSTPGNVMRWNFEGAAFTSTPPTGNACPSGTTPVYRAYNNGYDRGTESNHRITSSLTAIQEVVSRGWSDEGIVMCAPN